MAIINLTQCSATKKQRAQGVVDFSGIKLEFMKKLLTFDDLPDSKVIYSRAVGLARLASDRADSLYPENPYPRQATRDFGFIPIYAFKNLGFVTV